MAPTDFPLLDEPLAIALVDTEGVHRGRAFDLLADDGRLVSWLDRQRVRIGADAGPSPEDAVLALRAALRRVFTAVTADMAPPGDDVRAINDALESGGGFDALDWSTTRGPTAVRRGDTVLGRLAESAVRVLAHADPGPLRRCGNPRCVLFFAAANPRRRYCSPACSLRLRVARHAARH